MGSCATHKTRVSLTKILSALLIIAMASSLSLQNSMNFVAPILKNQPLMVSLQEPALSAGNMVLGTMLGAPCRWRFNRSEISFPISALSGTDYTISIPSFGFMENMWVIDATGKYYAVEGKLALSVDGSSGRPENMAPQFDDNAGNITFRMDKTPDANYTCFVDFQNKAPQMTSGASLWSPIPDEFEYIFNQGFLCLMSLLTNDSRFPIFENYFISRLLGAQDGLTDQERDIFIANWTQRNATLSRSAGSVNQGVAGRGK